MTLLDRIRQHVAHYVAAIFALLFILAIALAHRYSPSQATELIDDLIHSLHGPGFAGVAILTFAALEAYKGTIKNYLYAFVICMGIGVLSEAAQIPGPRDASVKDLVVDSIGVIGGLGIIAIFDRDLRSSLNLFRRWGLYAVSVLMLTISFAPTLWYAYVMLEQYKAFPSLATFESAWESSVIGQGRRVRPVLISAPANWPDVSAMVAHVTEVGRWGILIRVMPYPDWSDYQKLTFVAASADGRTHDVSVSIRDIPPAGKRRGIHYYEQITVGPEPRKYEIRLSNIPKKTDKGSFDFEHIETIVLSAWEPGDGVTLYIDDFRLE